MSPVSMTRRALYPKLYLSGLSISLVVICPNKNLTYTTKQDSRVSCVAQTGFAAFGKGVQFLITKPMIFTVLVDKGPNVFFLKGYPYKVLKGKPSLD